MLIKKIAWILLNSQIILRHLYSQNKVRNQVNILSTNIFFTSRNNLIPPVPLFIYSHIVEGDIYTDLLIYQIIQNIISNNIVYRNRI